jgi:hypothetical protein
MPAATNKCRLPGLCDKNGESQFYTKSQILWNHQ